MGVAWSVRSRLTLKRQKLRRGKGRLYMPVLGQIIREIEREAASLSTAELRHEIEINLEVQDAAIRQYYAVPPDGRKVEDLIMANSAVMVSVITTALYVRELASALATNVHRLGYAALGFGRPQRCWRSLRMRARSRRWAARTSGWRAWALRQRR